MCTVQFGFDTRWALFSPACIAHEIITSSDWTQVAVEGVTLSDALSCWAAGLPDTVPDSLAGSPDVSALGLEIRSQFASDDNLIISDLKDCSDRHRNI